MFYDLVYVSLCLYIEINNCNILIVKSEVIKSMLRKILWKKNIYVVFLIFRLFCLGL